MRLPRALRNTSLVVGRPDHACHRARGRPCARSRHAWRRADGHAPALRGPSAAHWLGTDNFGRDLWTRMIFGARISLSIALLSVGVAATIGSIVRPRGRLFRRLDRPAADADHRYLPGLPGAHPRARDRRRARARGRERLARPDRRLLDRICAGGAGDDARAPRAGLHRGRPGARGIERAHPVSRDPAERGRADHRSRHARASARPSCPKSALSFLGFGVPPPQPTWGWTLAYGTRFIRAEPWLSIVAGLAIMLTVLGFNLLGDGLRDILDPAPAVARRQGRPNARTS